MTPTKKKIIIATAIIILVLSSLLYYFSLELSVIGATKLHYSRAKTPSAYAVPSDRVVDAKAKDLAFKSSLSCKWFKFKAPWKLLERHEGSTSNVFFVFSDESVRKGMEIGIENILITNHSEYRNFQPLLDKLNLTFEYLIADFCLRTTPDDAAFLAPRDKLAIVPSMLIWKTMYAAYGSVTYRFSVNDLKCFQFSNPETADFVRVLIFDNSNRVFIISFIAATQEEIDSILSSIKFL
jgi:hypothetical protein